MEAKKSIEALQFFVTHLSNGAFAHFVQGKHFEAMGFSKLGTKYTEHYTEEMGWVEKFMSRINDLGSQVKIEDRKGRDIVADPVDYVKEDLRIQQEGVVILRDCMKNLVDDPTTYDLLKAYLVDEEEDLYWSQGAVEMIDMIGKQNWLVTQL